MTATVLNKYRRGRLAQNQSHKLLEEGKNSKEYVPLVELLLCVILGGSDMIVDERLVGSVVLVPERIDENLVWRREKSERLK